MPTPRKPWPSATRAHRTPLSASALAVLSLLAQSAWAQSGGASAPAAPETAASNPPQLETVVVSGQRAALQSGIESVLEQVRAVVSDWTAMSAALHVGG